MLTRLEYRSSSVRNWYVSTILLIWSSVSWFWCLPFLLRGVDEEHVIRLLALLQHKGAYRDAGRVEKVRRQADNCVDVTVLKQLRADALFRPTSEKHTLGKDDGHNAVVLQVVEPVQ
jgi:hypothetical protein